MWRLVASLYRPEFGIIWQIECEGNGTDAYSSPIKGAALEMQSLHHTCKLSFDGAPEAVSLRN